MRLVAAAIALVAVVLGVQTLAGGGAFAPRAVADPCRPRSLDPVAARLEPLAERIVLTGIDEAACAQRSSRERYLLDIAVGEPVDADALRAGLLRGAERISPLPPVSALLGEALDLTGLPGFLKAAVKAIPDAVVDGLLPTRELLRRAIAELDVDGVLAGLDDPAALEPALRSAILRAGRDQIVASVRGLLP